MQEVYQNFQSNAIFCDSCTLWVQQNCANLSRVQLYNISNIDEDWYCQKCLNDTFPFSSLTNENINNTNVFPLSNNFLLAEISRLAVVTI